jgi:hypothetical protein
MLGWGKARIEGVLGQAPAETHKLASHDIARAWLKHYEYGPQHDLQVAPLDIAVLSTILSSLASSDECLTVPSNELLNGHRVSSAYGQNEVAHAGEDSVLMVDGNLAEMLYKIRTAWASRTCSPELVEFVDRDLLILDIAVQSTADFDGNFRLGQFNGPEEGVGFARMRGWVFEHGDDDASLVFSSNRGMTPCGAKRRQHLALADRGREIEEPFREIRWPDVACGNSRPIEDPLREPVLPSGMAFGIPASRYLRHIYDEFHTGFFGSLCKLGCGLDDAGENGVAKVSSLDVLEGGPYLVEFEKITEDYLGAKLLEPVGSLVLAMREHSHPALSGK